MKKIVGYIVIVLLFAGTICGVTFGIMYAQNENYIQENSSVIEQAEELQEQISVLQNDKNELILKVDNLQSLNEENLTTIENYKIQVETLTTEKTQKETELAEKNAYIVELETAKSELENQAEIDSEEIDRLNGLLSQANTDKTNLQSEIDEKTEEINLLTTAKTQLEEENAELENTISTLKADKIELQNQITDLQAQLKAYEDMNLTDYYKLEFVNSSTDLVVSSLYLKEGSSFEIPTIEQTKDTWFYGWSTIENSGVVFDFSNFEVDNDYTFYSVLGETVPVRFNDNEYCYYFGKNLTIRDILVFDNRVDLSDENLELSLTNNVSLDTAITSLPTKMYSLGSGIYTKPEYVLDVQINFNFNKAPSVYFFEEGDTTMAVETIEGLDKYSVNFLSLKNLNFTLTSDKEGFTDTIEFSNFQNNEGKVFSNRIEYSTTGSFAGYNFAITFGNFFIRNGYGFNINFETVPSGINNIKLINCSFKYELESSYITLLSGAFGAEVPDARV